VSLLLRFLGAPVDPELPPRQLVVTPPAVRPVGVVLTTSTRAGDEPSAPRPFVYAPARAREGARAIVATSRAEPPVVADDTRIPVPLVVVPPTRLTTTRPIVIWTRTDPEVVPRSLVFTPSAPRRPGVVLTLRSTADPVVVAGDAVPWPALVVTSRRTPAAASVYILTPRFGEEPASCTTDRPSTGTTVYATATTARPTSGTTTRPGTGTTTYALATTARPGTGSTVYNQATTSRPGSGTTARPNSGTTVKPAGTTTRPDTGVTQDPC